MIREGDLHEPDATLAAAIATSLAGRAPASVVRFSAGLRHYVFDARFAEGDASVVRIGVPAARAELLSALRLSEALRPLGVPLPKILASDTEAKFPWLALERLPGTDLGFVISDLSQVQLDRIAARVAAAQAIVAKTPSAGRYGYAARPDQAPHERWSGVIEAHLDRSEGRIVAAGQFDRAHVRIVRNRLEAMRAKLDATAATPFLHDTTTKNVIVAPGGEFSGVVDVDDLCFGDARYPAALTLAVLMATGGPQPYVAAWLRHAGARDDEIFRLYVAAFLLDLMSEHGHAFNGNETPSTAKARSSLLAAFTDNLPLLQS